MATTTFQGVTRSYGGGKKKDVSPGVLTMSVVASYLASSTDATVATANLRIGTSSTVGEFFVLPKGAIPISVMPVNASVGGSTPTTDIGSAVDPDGFFDNINATGKGTIIWQACLVPEDLPQLMTGILARLVFAAGGILTLLLITPQHQRQLTLKFLK